MVAAALWEGVGGAASVSRCCLRGETVKPGKWVVSLPLLAPGLVPPGRRIAVEAPRLMRRWKGLAGIARAAEADSSSSIAFSSSESELLVDRLARRAKEALLVGEVPERPREVVVRDSLRRCSLRAAVVIALGKTGVPVAVELLRWKRLVNAAEVTEPRRLRCISAGGGEGGLVLLLELALSEDIVTVLEWPQGWGRRLISGTQELRNKERTIR